jgi:hypothetical protein
LIATALDERGWETDSLIAMTTKCSHLHTAVMIICGVVAAATGVWMMTSLVFSFQPSPNAIEFGTVWAEEGTRLVVEDGQLNMVNTFGPQRTLAVEGTLVPAVNEWLVRGCFLAAVAVLIILKRARIAVGALEGGSNS